MRRLWLAMTCAFAATALIGVPAATSAVGANSSALRQAVTVSGILAHEQAFMSFANDSIPAFGHPTRVDGSVGFTESVNYVASKAASYGYNVTVQNFTFDRFVESAPPVFTQTSPTPTTYVEGTDFLTMEYSGAGDVTAAVVPTNDLVLPPVGGSTSGCELADFPASVAGKIALVQRGTCTFRQKAENAAAKGAIGVIIFNEGNSPDRVGVINGTLSPPQMSLPVIGTTFAVGNDLNSQIQASQTPVVHLKVTASVITTPSQNVIADSTSGRADRTVVVGAHLDSVTEGPGINDNGSGSATILEVAKQMSQLGITPTNRVRFAWWGGEEFGLLGSEYYVSHLPTSELKNIMLNLNFDMVASPNFVRFVYDGDGSGTGTKGPNGSGNIEKVFNDYFGSQGLATAPTAFDGRSDYGPFIDRGIPAGGLFTGAEGIKTAQQAAVYGGTAGVAYDHCYHQLCDDLTNLNNTGLDQMSDGVADATLQFAMTTSAVNGTSKASDKATASTDFQGNFLRK
jgi:Zn-dependent M28 family amino/carboxypeptidase